MTENIKVGILRGGACHPPEYHSSIQSGKVALYSMPFGCEPVDIFIDGTGLWHIGGLPTSLEELGEKVDVIFNALHGPFALSDNLEEALEALGKPCTGLTCSKSNLPIDRIILNNQLKELGFKTPFGILVKDNPQEVFERVSPPWVVKPPEIGTVGPVYRAYNMTDLSFILEDFFRRYGSAYVEEYVKGTPAGSGIIENFRGAPFYRLLPEAKIGRREREEVQAIAEALHQVLGLRHYSKFDFVVAPRRGVVITDVKPLPRLGGSFSEMLSDIGCPLPTFLGHVINLAREEEL